MNDRFDHSNEKPCDKPKAVLWTGHAGDYGSFYEVNVREILADSLRGSLLILDSLNQGADMAELARTRSRRPAWATRGGESGFFRVSAYPQLGFVTNSIPSAPLP